MNQDQRRLLARWEARQGSLGGTYADYVYHGEQLFLEAAAKGINSLARGHGKAMMRRAGGRAPFLTYEGQDMNDFDFEMTFSLAATSHSGVVVHYFGKGAYTGKFDGKAPMKWGTLRPDFIVSLWKARVGIF